MEFVPKNYKWGFDLGIVLASYFIVNPVAMVALSARCRGIEFSHHAESPPVCYLADGIPSNFRQDRKRSNGFV